MIFRASQFQNITNEALSSYQNISNKGDMRLFRLGLHLNYEGN